jgi:glycosyltransferase involved in cell wall biosynthesis
MFWRHSIGSEMSMEMKSIFNPRVLVVAPGHRGRGGIDSVIRLYQGTSMWKEMSCRMLSTYDDKSILRKIVAAIRGYLLAPAAFVRADIIHVHLAGEISLLRKVPMLALAKALRRLLIVHVHACSEESLFIKTPRWAWRYSLHAADRVIALSPSWEKAIRRHVAGARVIVVPNPVRSFLPPTRRCRMSARVLYVGKLEPRKGYDTLIRAAALVLNEFPQTDFWFAGHGQMDAAQSQAEHYGVSSHIHLLGWVTAVELEQIYSDVDLFCLPSHNEGVPMSMLEAMSHSLPVVCTPVGGIPDIIEDGTTGLLVNPESSDSVAEGILRLLRDSELALSIAQAGRTKVEAMCSLDAVSAQMTAIYRDLAKSARSVVVEVDHGI